MQGKKKKRIIIISIIAVLIAAIIGGSVAISANSAKIQFYILYHMMPDSIEDLDPNFPYEIYKRQNEDFDIEANIDNPVNAIDFYYYDEEGNEVSIHGDEKFNYNGKEIISPYVGFMLKAYANYNHLKSVIRTVVAVVVILVVIVLIVLWFFLWSKKQDKEKAEKSIKSFFRL